MDIRRPHDVQVIVRLFPRVRKTFGVMPRPQHGHFIG